MTNRADRKQPSEGYIHLPNGKLHYLDWRGSGRQIHFLHANGFCAGTYSPFLNHLTGDFHVVASDVRGHGGTNLPNIHRVHHWNIFADDLKTLIDQTMSPPIIGLGHSLGAVTTCIAAARHPHLFSAVILLDPVFLPARTLWRIALIRMLGLRRWLPKAKSARQRKRYFASKQAALNRFANGRGIFKTWSPDFIEAYMQCGLLVRETDSAILRCDPELEAQIFESVPLNVWQMVQRIECPIFAIRGEHSDTFPAESARRLEKTAGDVRIACIPGAGHFLPMEKPKKTAQEVAGFIDRTLADSRSIHKSNAAGNKDLLLHRNCS